jgi:hypothetical protein
MMSGIQPYKKCSIFNVQHSMRKERTGHCIHPSLNIENRALIIDYYFLKFTGLPFRSSGHPVFCLQVSKAWHRVPFP